jgi:hypothetical protein
MWFSPIKKNDPVVIYENETDLLLKCDTEYLKTKAISNWSKNRPPDNVRISEIMKFYIDNDVTLVPGIICFWEINNSSIVYDGIYRLLAAIGTGKNMTFLVSFKRTLNEQDIIDEFININKSICVPSIYIENTDALKKMICQNVAEELCKKYPTFVSPSRKPFVYNFNRDNIVEFISTLDIDFSKPDIEKVINNELKAINLEAKDFVMRKKLNVPRKCEYNQFYLFYLDKPIIKMKLEKGISYYKKN